MEIVFEARKLANYIGGLDTFETLYVESEFCYQHIGALFVDITLQAGLNYQSVVKPRVQRVLLNYPEADTVLKFRDAIEAWGLETIIKWRNSIKINRLERLISFALANEINTCADFKIFLMNANNREEFQKLNGVGPKTVDYTLKLLNFDTVAVDRHIYAFVEMADVKPEGYAFTKKVVEFAADFLQISRSSMDYSIWKYMSNAERSLDKNTSQLELAL
ncbi:hypothetical protein [Pedobacter sp. R20-19]|uniref:hypothetical protein n=1 Tax=Pedobacter sp. R20-19 TaxID=1270196 RepID=UPI00068AEEE1|nr:hypothetical protein [Pedobacter sp. R20-19]